MGRSPWTAADAPVGLLAPCKTLTPLFRMRDEGVPRRPGGLPHNFRSIADSGKTSGIRLKTCAAVDYRRRPAANAGGTPTKLPHKASGDCPAKPLRRRAAQAVQDAGPFGSVGRGFDGDPVERQGVKAVEGFVQDLSLIHI